MRYGVRAIFCLALCMMLGGVPLAGAQPVVDDRGQSLRWSAPPQRIVSLLPALTETVCALGACERLVGVDRDSNYPSLVQRLPRVGGGLDPSIEAIVALRPDVVLMAASAQGMARLQALGLKVLAFEPRTHADVQRVMMELGRLLAIPDAALRWQAIETELQAVARMVPPAARGVRVYFEVSSAPHAASESSFIGETLQRLGVRNIVPGALGPFPQLNPEFVVRAQPDLIMKSEGMDVPLAQRPGWAALKALRQGRVCAFGAAQTDVLHRPGPRLAQGARLMAQCLVDQAAAW